MTARFTLTSVWCTIETVALKSPKDQSFFVLEVIESPVIKKSARNSAWNSISRCAAPMDRYTSTSATFKWKTAGTEWKRWTWVSAFRHQAAQPPAFPFMIQSVAPIERCTWISAPCRRRTARVRSRRCRCSFVWGTMWTSCSFAFYADCYLHRHRHWNKGII